MIGRNAALLRRTARMHRTPCSFGQARGRPSAQVAAWVRGEPVDLSELRARVRADEPVACVPAGQHGRRIVRGAATGPAGDLRAADGPPVDARSGTCRRGPGRPVPEERPEVRRGTPEGAVAVAVAG